MHQELTTSGTSSIVCGQVKRSGLECVTVSATEPVKQSQQQTPHSEENPIVFWLSPLPPEPSVGPWRSAGFRERDWEMFPVAGLSAAD